jgi:hypothetical protein
VEVAGEGGAPALLEDEPVQGFDCPAPRSRVDSLRV